MINKCVYPNNVYLTITDDKINVYTCCIHMGKSLDAPILSIPVDKIYEYDIFDELKKIRANKTNFKYKYNNGDVCWCDEFNEVKNIHVSVSKVCNIDCKMCFVHDKIKTKDGIENDKKLYFYILNTLAKQNLDSIRFTESGEPFYYKKDVINWLDSLTNIKTIYITSNLTLLTENDIETLHKIALKNNITFKIKASIAAMNNETYKKVHNNNNFNKVIKNAKLLNKYNMLDMIGFTVTPDNVYELPEAIEYWAKENVIVGRWLVNDNTNNDPVKQEVLDILEKEPEIKKYIFGGI